MPTDTPHLPSLVYLVYREALSSVFASQVLTPLEAHREFMPVTLGLFAPLGHLTRRRHRADIESITQRCRESRIDLGWIPSPPTRAPWLWSDRWLLRQWLRRKFPGDDPYVIRCRGARMTGLALAATRDWPHVRVIYDCRGAEVVEAIQMAELEGVPREHWSPQATRLIGRVADEERCAVLGSAGVTCVSHAMVSVLRQRYPMVPADRFMVVPCCPDVAAFSAATPQREAARQAMGLKGRFVVTYLGSLVWYQMPEESLRIFRLIQSIRPDAHFLAITTSPAAMHALIEKSGIEKSATTVRSCPPQDVPRWLVASDMGLMLRDRTETNRVASPVKFGEYLAAGVPVVVSQGLGDCTAVVRDGGLGVTVDLDQSDEVLCEQLRTFVTAAPEVQQTIRSRCIERAENELQWSRFVPPLINWYQQLMANDRIITSDVVGVR